MQKKLKYQAILLLLLMPLTMFLTASGAEAKVEAQGNKIVMDVQDAINLYRYIAELEAENKALKEGLEREREATQKYVDAANNTIQNYENERLAWQKLEQEMNAELKSEVAKKYKTAAIALIIGTAIGAAVN